MLHRARRCSPGSMRRSDQSERRRTHSGSRSAFGPIPLTTVRASAVPSASSEAQAFECGKQASVAYATDSGRRAISVVSSTVSVTSSASLAIASVACLTAPFAAAFVAVAFGSLGMLLSEDPLHLQVRRRPCSRRMSWSRQRRSMLAGAERVKLAFLPLVKPLGSRTRPGPCRAVSSSSAVAA